MSETYYIRASAGLNCTFVFLKTDQSLNESLNNIKFFSDQNSFAKTVDYLQAVYYWTSYIHKTKFELCKCKIQNKVSDDDEIISVIMKGVFYIRGKMPGYPTFYLTSGNRPPERSCRGYSDYDYKAYFFSDPNCFKEFIDNIRNRFNNTDLILKSTYELCKCKIQNKVSDDDEVISVIKHKEEIILPTEKLPHISSVDDDIEVISDPVEEKINFSKKSHLLSSKRRVHPLMGKRREENKEIINMPSTTISTDNLFKKSTETLTQDAISAAYQVAANQIVSTVVKSLEASPDFAHKNVILSVLQTPHGKAVLSFILGTSQMLIPQLEGEKLDRLGSSLRVNGMASVMNGFVEQFIAALITAFTTVSATLPNPSR